jgi:hypothetical protein
MVERLIADIDRGARPANAPPTMRASAMALTTAWQTTEARRCARRGRRASSTSAST